MSHPSSEIGIESLPAGGEEELLAFYRENLEQWQRFRELYQWRKQAPSAAGSEQFFVARVNGAIVGSVGAVSVPVFLGARRVRASWQQDSLVSTTMRGKGVGRLLVEKAAQGWELAMAKGTSPAMYALRKAAGFVDVARSCHMLRVLTPRLRKAGPARAAAEIAAWGWGAVVWSRLRRRPAEAASLDGFGAEFDRFAGAGRGDPVFRPAKDSRYLNWRYFQCPSRHYQVISNVPRAGAVVLKLPAEAGGEGWIVDAVVDWREGDSGESLLAAGTACLEDSGAGRIWAFATLPAARRTLRRLGFVATSETPRFTVRPSGSLRFEESIPADFWHGDGDVELYP